MDTMSYGNLSVKGLKEALKSAKYGKYALLYLYDGISEVNGSSNVTRVLFSKYGYLINNRSGSDISVLTVIDRWCAEKLFEDGTFFGSENGFLSKEEWSKKYVFNCSLDYNRNNFKLMEDLAACYNVELPALVVVDTENTPDGKERYAATSFSGMDADEIKTNILKTINAIRDNYDDFYAISRAIGVMDRESENKLETELFRRGTLHDIVCDYLKKNGNMKQKDLAKALTVDDKTVQRYLKEREIKKNGDVAYYPLPRDTAIKIAFILKLTPEEADVMFDAATVEAVPRLGDYGREKIIRDSLEAGIDLKTVNNTLGAKGYLKVV